MKIKQRIAETLFGAIIDDLVEKKLTASSVTENEDAGWTKLTGNSNRNLSAMKQDRMIEIAFWLWENNPFANWIIETTVDFILADGLPYETKNEKIKDVLDSFWNDPVNRMSISIKKILRELRMYGEICLPIFVSGQAGKVRLGYVDPAQIKIVVTDPENVKMVIGVILKDRSGRTGKKYKTVLPEGAEEILSTGANKKREYLADGECFFYAINNVTNSPRGRSDLLSIADALDAYEQYIWDYAERWPLLNAFVWDLLVEGGKKEDIENHVKNFTKKSGSVFGHNEKLTLEAKSPDLKAVDAEKGARLFRNHILGSKSIPEHWYGGGGDVNRATAAEMGTPAFKSFASKQTEFKYILEDILRFVILKAKEAKTLSVGKSEENCFSIITPEIAVKDITKHSSAIQQVTTSLIAAESQSWIDKATAAKVFALIIAPLGMEIDYEEAKKYTKGKEEKKGYEDYED